MNFILTFLLLFQNIEPEKRIATDALDFQVDKLGNIYFIHSTFVEKLDSEGNFLFRTGDIGYGTITSLDVSDPLKPFLFFKDQGIIYPMDNTLSVQGSVIRMFESDYTQVECVGWSRDNHYWIWENTNGQLIQMDRNFQRMIVSSNIMPKTDKTIKPVQIVESGYYVYVVDKAAGILQYSIYSQYIKTLPFVQMNEAIQLTEDNVLIADSTTLHMMEKNLVAEVNFPLPQPTKSRVVCSGKKMMMLMNGELLIYDLEKITTIRN